MSDQHGNTTDDTVHQRGAWFVYYEHHLDDGWYPVGVFGADDELEARRLAGQQPEYVCLWWPYGWSLEDALYLARGACG